MVVDEITEVVVTHEVATFEHDAITREGRELGQPARVDVRHQGARHANETSFEVAVSTGFIEETQVDVALASVRVDYGLPHGPPRWVVGPHEAVVGVERPGADRVVVARGGVLDATLVAVIGPVRAGDNATAVVV